MPLYEYYCSDCRGKFEVLSSFQESEAGVTCTKCQGARVRKMFSVFAARSAGDQGLDNYGSGDFGEASDFGGGCACGGACSCGGH